MKYFKCLIYSLSFSISWMQASAAEFETKYLQKYDIFPDYTGFVDGTCYEDLEKLRLLGIKVDDTIGSPKECIEACLKKGYVYAGIQYTHQCYCGNYKPPPEMIRNINDCNNKCTKDSSQKCGGFWHMNIYKTGTCVGFGVNTVSRKSIGLAIVTESWLLCAKMCRVSTECKYWTWIFPNVGQHSKKCILMTGFESKVNHTKTVSGGRNCPRIFDSVCTKDVDIGNSSDTFKDIGITHRANECKEECSKCRECQFFVWSGPDSKRCLLRKRKETEFSQIPRTPLKGAVAGLKKCEIRKITSIVSSCTKRGVGKWNTEGISDELVSWIRSVVTIGNKGPIQSKLYDSKTADFMDHFAGYNDFPVITSYTDMTDETNKEHITVVTLGKFEDKNNDKRIQLVPGKIAWQWKSRKAHDGFLYGPVDYMGMFTGENITFLYPDLLTGLRGKFVNGQMVEAREVRVVAERCANGIRHLKMKLRNKRKHLVWEKEETNITYIGKYAKEADPYERRTSFINDSTIIKGDGIFAKRKLLPGDIAAYYSGQKTWKSNYWFPNMTSGQTQAANSYTYAFGRATKGYHNNMNLDIGVGLRGRTQYRTTIGHKVNHKFKGTNSRFGDIRHPSFGDIVSIEVTKVIEKGEEVFINYNYGYDKNTAPNWWANAYLKTYSTQLN